MERPPITGETHEPRPHGVTEQILRLAVLVGIGVLSVGATYFFSYNRERSLAVEEIERQNKLFERVLDAIERCRNNPNVITRHDADLAVDEAREQEIGTNRYGLLLNFKSDGERCQDYSARVNAVFHLNCGVGLLEEYFRVQQALRWGHDSDPDVPIDR